MDCQINNFHHAMVKWENSMENDYQKSINNGFVQQQQQYHAYRKMVSYSA
jgi:hypothetical protein